jgi:uncharacterized hydrophobic protein (TIGR00341 family)
MSLRLIEVTLPKDQRQAVEELLGGRKDVLEFRMHPITGTWNIPMKGVWTRRFSTDYILIRIIVQAEESQALLDLLSDKFSNKDGFRINIISIEASLPKFPNEEQLKEGDTSEDIERHFERISREELYNQLDAAAKATDIYMIMIALSSIVAAFGILNNNVVIIIGAMVIAPLLGPNVALSLATTLGDLSLAKGALKTNLLGILIATAISIALGAILYVDPKGPEIAYRTEVGLTEMIIALASGCAGALSFTTAAPGVLIGVAVAVSLLPPLVTFGLLLGAGYETLSLGALMLFLVNVICINLAGVATFLAQGITPRNWFEIKKARKDTVVAISIWVLLLAALIVIMVLSGQLRTPRLSFNTSIHTNLLQFI